MVGVAPERLLGASEIRENLLLAVGTGLNWLMEDALILVPASVTLLTWI